MKREVRIAITTVEDNDGMFYGTCVERSDKMHYARKPDVAIRMALEETLSIDLARTLLESHKITITLVSI